MSEAPSENRMSELQQARADYIASLEKVVALDKKISDLTQSNHELQMKLITAETRAVIAETCLQALTKTVIR